MRRRSSGYHPGQPKVLECLMEQGESNQKAIADYCEIEQATVGSILTRMERDGLIVRNQRGGQPPLPLRLSDAQRQGDGGADGGGVPKGGRPGRRWAVRRGADPAACLLEKVYCAVAGEKEGGVR